jgi:ABC-type multidrug transport system fused ATPase/permease subunit
MLHLFFKYLKKLKPFTPYVLLIFLGDMAVASFGLITPLFSRLLFDYAYPLRDLFLLNVVFAASIGFYFVQFFINVLCDYLNTFVVQSFGGFISRPLFMQCARLPLSFHNSRGTGDLINLFTHDVDVIVDKSVSTLPSVIIQIYTLASILAVAFFMNPKITALALLSIPLYVLETKYFARKEEKLEEREIELDGEYFDVLSERFDGIRTVKAFGQERAEMERVALKKREINIVGIKKGLVTVISVFANSVTIRMWSVFLGWYMGYLVIGGELTVGEIVALLAYVAMMAEPIQTLAKTYGDLKVAMVSYRRVDAVLEARPEDEGDGGKDLELKEGAVAFDAVDFTYDEESDDKVLDELSFKVAPKSSVAVVGESGSGKSTVISLIMRFYRPTGGAIYIDGQDLSEVKLASLRGQIGLVQQDFNLFAGTLRDNLLYGTDGKSAEDIERALRQAQIYDFVASLEDGLDHEVGTGGDGLSGGQKQRFAIARVLLRDPQIIIFDEATSALDPESEFKITEVINGLIGKKSLFIVAHRLSTIKKADTIMMLEDGKITECGTFHELIDKKGAFFRYYNRQFGGFEAFKKVLEIEYERAGRYGSKFNLVAVRVDGYADCATARGDDFAFDYVDEVCFFIRRNLRKGDSATAFYKDVILILLPEIGEDQVRDTVKRLNGLCETAEVSVRDAHVSVVLSYSAVHVQGTPFSVVDDLISLAVGNLKKIREGENLFTETVTNKENKE